MRKASILILLTIVVFSCQETVEESEFKRPEDIHNPNGDSELAIVMRNLHFEANKVGKALETGDDADLTALKSLASRVSTAVPTPGHHLDSGFYNFSASLTEKIKGLSETDNKKIEFNSIVNTCVACHQTTCPGPIKKIRKLQIQA